MPGLYSAGDDYFVGWTKIELPPDFVFQQLLGTAGAFEQEVIEFMARWGWVVETDKPFEHAGNVSALPRRAQALEEARSA